MKNTLAEKIIRCSQINQLILIIQKVTCNEFMNDIELHMVKGKLYCINNGKGFLFKNNQKKPVFLDCGGTMWCLLQDFVDWIKTGEYSNHKHGNGGLYGYIRWNGNYTKEQIKPVFTFAKKIGYLFKDDDMNYKESKKY